MQTSELQSRLNRLGFDAGPVDGLMGPMTATATARFQLACALPGHHLVVDAIPGPRTWAALRAVETQGDRLAPHFTVAELRTRTRANGPKDGTCWVHRDLLRALEELRAAKMGRPLSVISGWRDPAHNSRVGGAAASQHTYGPAPELHAIRSRLRNGAMLNAGRAVDIPQGYVTLVEAKRLGFFTGLGYRGAWVTHVDVRPGNPLMPVTWRYG